MIKIKIELCRNHLKAQATIETQLDYPHAIEMSLPVVFNQLRQALNNLEKDSMRRPRDG